MAKSFLEAVKERRTYYSISDEAPVDDKVIQETIQEAIKHAPSAFNSQSARVIVLLGKHHKKFWDLTKEELKKIVPAEAFVQTENKINNAFRAGYGTVVFFEDENVVKQLQTNYPTYSAAFHIFSHHSSGMLQLIVWTALEQLGFGASLQHYSPLIDAPLAKEWDIPSHWKVIAQMPFGKPTASPSEKSFSPIEERFKIFK